MRNESYLKELYAIRDRVNALIALMEREDSNEDGKKLTTTKIIAKKTTVGEVKKKAILEEIYRLGGTTTPDVISELAIKYGRNPSSTAGYYSGKKPSLIATEDKKARKLTPYGESIVKQTRTDWGEDWLDRVPLDIVGNENTPDMEIEF